MVDVANTSIVDTLQRSVEILVGVLGALRMVIERVSATMRGVPSTSWEALPCRCCRAFSSGTNKLQFLARSRKKPHPSKKMFGHEFWALIVVSPTGCVAPMDIPGRPSMERQAKLLRSELVGMASFRLEETIQPPRDVIDSMQGLMLQMESFMKRATTALGWLSLERPVL